MALTNEDLLAISNLLKAEVEPIKAELGSIKAKLTSIELTLENETNKEIRIIAEGHLDLSRKLDDALRINSEKELLLLRVTLLENELRKTKERLAEIEKSIA